jgi:hypothetical protein
MLARIRSSLTYANVIATLALFLALGGGAYAAFKLPNNSVTSRQIKNNAVTSPKVKNRSLLAQDFKAGQLPAGPRGPQGVQGVQGVDGSTLKAGSVRIVVGPRATATPANGGVAGSGDGFASCAAGETLVGGGFTRAEVNDAFPSVDSPDSNTPNRWFVRLVNMVPVPLDFNATAICVKTG